MKRIILKPWAGLYAIIALTGCGKTAANVSTDVAGKESLTVDTTQAFYLQSAYSGKVLDVVNGSTTPGARLQQWDQTGGTNQQFRFVAQSNGTYEVVGVGSGNCLDVYSDDAANGTIVQMWQCYGGPAQQWKIVSTSGSEFFLVSASTNSCVDVSGPTNADGALAQEWSCWTGAQNQQFTMVSVNGSSTGTTSNTGGLHVSGNQLVDGNGNPVRLQGVDIPSLEWSNGEPNAGSSPPPCYAGQTIMNTVQQALSNYHVNYVRLPISQDRWWNAVDGQVTSYRATVDAIVNAVTSAGGYINVDLHWSDAGVWGQNIGQHEMPDDNTATVWADLAAHYANNPSVIFGLYNEPHDVDWNTWLNGGTVYDNGLTYHSPGIGGLLQVVRNTGAKNVVIAGGLDWAFDLTGVANGYALPDSNVVYDAHVYPWKGDSSNWDAKVSVASGSHPIVVSEFGANYDNLSGFSSPQAFISTIQGWLNQHNYGFAAWDLHPTATPALISDWCYTPTPYFGSVTIPWL